MGRALLQVIAFIVAAIAWGISRGSGWIYERAARIAEDLEAASLPDY